MDRRNWQAQERREALSRMRLIVIVAVILVVAVWWLSSHFRI